MTNIGHEFPFHHPLKEKNAVQNRAGKMGEELPLKGRGYLGGINAAGP